MKKIIISIASIGLVGAFAIGGTIAFYKDTETSTGNVFTAGSIDLTVDSSGAVYNDGIVNDSKWEPKDLDGERFFDFADIKPADHGNRNLSLHVKDNDSWACLIVDNKVNDENIAIDPEIDAGDSATSTVGELDANTEVFVWQDNNDDGLYNAGDDALTAEDGVTLATLDSVAIADSTTGSPLTSGQTREIYIAWCAGDQTVNKSAGTITCDGGGMSDVAQTDSFSADMTVYAEQTRNNEDFKCSEVVLPVRTDRIIKTGPNRTDI